MFKFRLVHIDEKEQAESILPHRLHLDVFAREKGNQKRATERSGRRHRIKAKKGEKTTGEKEKLKKLKKKKYKNYKNADLGSEDEEPNEKYGSQASQAFKEFKRSKASREVGSNPV